MLFIPALGRYKVHGSPTNFELKLTISADSGPFMCSLGFLMFCRFRVATGIDVS